MSSGVDACCVSVVIGIAFALVDTPASSTRGGANAPMGARLGVVEGGYPSISRVPIETTSASETVVFGSIGNRVGGCCSGGVIDGVGDGDEETGASTTVANVITGWTSSVGDATSRDVGISSGAAMLCRERVEGADRFSESIAEAITSVEVSSDTGCFGSVDVEGVAGVAGVAGAACGRVAARTSILGAASVLIDSDTRTGRVSGSSVCADMSREAWVVTTDNTAGCVLSDRAAFAVVVGACAAVCVGACVGAGVGTEVGISVGCDVCANLGCAIDVIDAVGEGESVGVRIVAAAGEGARVGASVGVAVGTGTGASVGVSADDAASRCTALKRGVAVVGGVKTWVAPCDSGATSSSSA